MAENTIFISKVNETYIKISGERDILNALAEKFTYTVEGAQYMKSVINKIWDGKVSLLDRRTGLLFLGLHSSVKAWCDQNGVSCVYNDPINVETAFSVVEAQKMVNILQLSREIGDSLHPKRVDMTLHDYQEKAVIHAIQAGRTLLLSPTSSGKSAVLYVLVRYYLARTKSKILIIAPSGQLVKQLFDDFVDYSFKINWNAEDYCHLIYKGATKETDKRVVISTWQALAVKERLSEEQRANMTKWQIKDWNKKAPFKLDQEFFGQFGTVLNDECHLTTAEELTKIMTSLTNAIYRHGTTGTLKDAKANHMILEGLFGDVYQTITTAKMIEDKKAAELDIKVLQLQYSDEERKQIKKIPYHEEIEFIQAHKGRMEFIINLTLSLKGNVLILFEKIEKHGQIIYNILNERKQENQKLFFISGEVDPDERNEIRDITEGETDAIIVASMGTTSAGYSIRNINHVISVAGGKSKIRLFQAIGRGLRLSETKFKVCWYDIADDLSVWSKNKKELHLNYSLQHMTERINYYIQENLPYRVYKIDMAQLENFDLLGE